MKKELRYLENAEVRAAAGRKISGYAAVFDSPAIISDFEEVVRPGAFSRALRQRQDVPLLLNHDPSRVLGRTVSGTLTLQEDSRGLHFDCELSDGPTAQDALAMIRRGDVNACSFAFAAREDRWNTDGSKRELWDVDLFDVSAVTYPAYSQTTVSARSGAGNPSLTGSYRFQRPAGSTIYRGELRDEALEDLRRARKADLLQAQIRFEGGR